MGPYFLKASSPYCEQVGVYRHEGPSHGEITTWYILIKTIKGNDNICFMLGMPDKQRYIHTKTSLKDCMKI